MKGILFKPEVWKAKQAVLDQYGEAQTRRVIKPQPTKGQTIEITMNPHVVVLLDWEIIGSKAKSRVKNISSRYHAGETVYIKEAYCFLITMDNLSPSEIYYKYGAFQRKYLLDGLLRGENPYSLPMTDGRVRSPMMMPEWAARHFITITAMRAERLQEITEVDAIKEGIPNGAYAVNQITSFKRLWNSINPDYPWESNPWVFAYTFRLEVK